MPTVVVHGDEYLNVNVWTPSGTTGLPVMLWVHGGSLAHGTNALDGSSFARDGVVFAAVRLTFGIGRRFLRF